MNKTSHKSSRVGIVFLTVLAIAILPALSDPCHAEEVARKAAFATNWKKIKVNVDGKACLLTSYEQCCSIDLTKEQPAHFRIVFDRNNLDDILRIVNLGPDSCVYKMNAEVSVPVRMGAPPANGFSVSGPNVLNTFLGGGSEKVVLQLYQDQPCKLAIFREAISRYNQGWGLFCKDEAAIENETPAEPAR